MAIFEVTGGRKLRGEITAGGAKNEELAAFASARDQALIEVIYSGGLRISEAMNMNFKDLDMLGGVIVVHGKGKKERLCALGRPARSALRNYLTLRRNRTAARNYPLLVELAEKYGRSQNQIVLNWILRHRQMQTIVKSLSPANISANLAALDFMLEEEDYARMDTFRCTESERIQINWGGGNGVPIDQLANQF